MSAHVRWIMRLPLLTGASGRVYSRGGPPEGSPYTTFGRRLRRDLPAILPCPAHTVRGSLDGPPLADAVLVSVFACVFSCANSVRAVSKSRQRQPCGCIRACTGADRFEVAKHSEQSTGRSPFGTNGTSVIWPHWAQVAGCICRGVRPPKLANGP